MTYLNAELQDEVLTVDLLVPTILDTLTVNMVFEELEFASNQFEPKCFLLNFEKVTLLTSEMLGKLIAFRQNSIDRKIELKLCNLNDSLIHLLEVTKLNTLFACYQSVEEAKLEFEDEMLIADDA